ncbi:uncharacterized protein VTP21DRAFT_9209 [Calcarisporiella thermophila]|uniref:uncharacterized protein n=1 Tax=Calcarisporiella thermophila TaxID=911321 RepID=UPI0037432467
MSLWVDKYRPTKLKDLNYHKHLSEHLERLAASGDFPHMLVYGPSGAGKKTRITCILREIFGPGAEKLKVEQRVFVTPSNKKLNLNIVTSNYHLEVNPSDVGIYDRVVVQDLIKEMAQTQQVDASASRRFKVVVINEADCLSRDAQAGLRRTMEKYMNNMRLILCCNSTSKIIAPVRSRCLLVRVAAPEVPDIVAVLEQVAKKEGFKLPSEVAHKIAETSDRNLRRAILTLEAAKVQHGVLQPGSEIPPYDWEEFVKQIAQMIVKEQSPTRLAQVRAKLYELLCHCIPPNIILKTLAFELIATVDTELKGEITKQAAAYEHKLQCGQKAIFHLEAFVAKVMCVYKKYLMQFDAY